MHLQEDKSGNVMILILSVIMCVMLPILAVVYDLGQIRMYQQDVKNAQEIAGLACVGVSKGSIDGGGAGGALGAFDKNKCERVATVTAWANLGVTAAAPLGRMDPTYINRTKQGKHERLVGCSGGPAPHVFVNSPNGGRNFIVQIQNVCYKPMFIKPSLLNFQMLKNNPYFINIKFRDELPVTVTPSWFSAVYDAAS